jgi:hypothetical protein
MQTESNEEVLNAAQVLYGEKPEPIDEPTDDVESVDDVELESTQEEELSSADEGQEQDESDGEAVEEVVFDKPNQFVKYKFDPETKMFEFKSDGKVIKANPDELIARFNQVQNYTKDKMRLADERKGVFEAAKAKELEAVRAEAQRQQEITSKLESLIGESEQNIDWEELRQYDTAEYIKQKELLQQRKEALSKTREESQRQQLEARQKHVDSEVRKLVDSFPEWTQSEEVRKQDLQLIDEGFSALGFTKEEAESLIDHRIYKAALMVAKFNKASEKAKQTKDVKKIPHQIKSQKASETSEPLSYADILYGKKGK